MPPRLHYVCLDLRTGRGARVDLRRVLQRRDDRERITAAACSGRTSIGLGSGREIGTRGGHDLSTALGNTWANLAVLLRHLYGWPSYLTLSLAFVPFVLCSWNRWDRLLLVSTLGLIVAHWLYWSDGIVYGPRFTFEATAALALLDGPGGIAAGAGGRRGV